jgi:hypothetical protein
LSPSRQTSRRSVGRHRSRDYWMVATHLMESARALVTLGEEEYGNAIGICLIHAIISANDAVTINVAEVRSTSEQHTDAQRLLTEVIPEVPAEVSRALGDVIRMKYELQYSGELLTLASARRLLRKAERFYNWANEQLG